MYKRDRCRNIDAETLAKRITSLSIILSLTTLLCACGEKYAMQGDRLSRGIQAYVLKNGFCQNASDCKTKFTILGEHGNQVNLNIYGVENKEVIAGVMAMVTTDGMKITGGVPIRIVVFSESKRETIERNLSPDPIQKMEIYK